MKNRPFFAAPTALALAVLAALSAAPPAVLALGVGRLNVQSALGEGMRAEIDISSLSAEEAGTLTVRVAPPESYRAAGVDYNAVLASTQAVVVRRPDGRAVLRLSSDRAVQEPFVEVILELTWASGRLVREFTLLFDPPGSRNAPPAQALAPVAPLIAAAPAPGPVALPGRPAPSPLRAAPAVETGAAPAAATPPAPKLARAPQAPSAAPRPSGAEPAQAPANPPAAPGGKRYAVRPGDTLYRVAGRHQQGGVSLDQMLVGLYRSNPEAFIAHNVNKLRAGAVLAVPSADEVRDVTHADMRRLIAAQSLDFSAYRSRLAQAAPLAQAPEPGRSAQGKVQASVDDRKQSALPSPDKLKLSGAAASSADSLASERKDNAAKVAELSRNVEALKQLQQGAAPTPNAAAPNAAVPNAAAPNATAPAAPAPAVVAAAPAAPAPPPAMAPAPAPAPASAPMVAAPAPPVLAAASRPAAPTLPVTAPALPDTPSGSLLDKLTASPWLMPVAGALALLLAGVGAWRLRGRLRKPSSETSFLESRMQPDSFFGASGGQHVDTRDASRTNASSMGYSLSQLDAIGDVDPVAEADVYLAYGRDLQAEEILKEAMRTTPERLAVRTKLLEVYAKRRDTKGFELLATQLYALTKGGGTDWARAQELGRQCDPDNQLYLPGGHPEEIILDGERVVVEPLGATTQPHSVLSAATRPFVDSVLPTLQGRPTASASSAVKLDSQFDALDLDLSESFDDGGAARRAMEATRPIAASVQRPIDTGLDFDFEDRTQPARRVATVPEPTAHVDLDSLTMDLSDQRSDTTIAMPMQRTGQRADNGADTTLDFSRFPVSEPGLLADTAPTTPGNLEEVALEGSDPLTRKLELAEEFRQIGDIDGARDLLEEVLAKATGTLRTKAQAMLDALS